MKIASAVDDAFAQLGLREDEVTPTTVLDELKRILNEEKSIRLTVARFIKFLLTKGKTSSNRLPPSAMDQGYTHKA